MLVPKLNAKSAVQPAKGLHSSVQTAKWLDARWLQGFRRPDHRRLKKQKDGEGDGDLRTHAEQVQANLGFDQEQEGKYTKLHEQSHASIGWVLFFPRAWA